MEDAERVEIRKIRHTIRKLTREVKEINRGLAESLDLYKETLEERRYACQKKS